MTTSTLTDLRAVRGRILSLVFYKTYADLRAESQRTYVGFLWWILEPVASMAVYYLVFSVILQRGGEDYVGFLFAGIVPWRWFQATTMRGSSSILSARGLMQQVYLPKVVLPLVTFLADTFKFALVFLLMLAYFIVSGRPPTLAWLALPGILLVQGLLVAGTTLLAGAMTPLLPDLRVVLQNVLRLWFFLSGVFYDIELFSAEAQRWLRLNPMAVLLVSYRDVLLDATWPDFGRLAAIAIFSTLVVALAILLLRRLDHVYPKLRF